MFSLSGPCELIFLLCLIASWTWVVVSRMLYPCCSVNESVCLVCCVFVNSLVKQFAIFLSVVVVLLLNFMEVLRVGRGALLDRPCMVCQRKCVLCL